MPGKSNYTVPLSGEISIGTVIMGGTNPVVLQSMTNTDTNDIEASVLQCNKIIAAGGEMVRLTTQGLREVKSISRIINELRLQNNKIPIVADVHFSAAVAEAASETCHKIRINPGNYTEKKRAGLEFSEEEFSSGESLNKEAFLSLLSKCREHGTSIRIGVNHGSLSNRIVSKYGDTPKGMVESAMEFLRICRDEDFRNAVVSLKSSNTRVMVQSVRLLVREMVREEAYFPVHLGVTEAGDGLEGRIRSAVGMAPLLLEGIGNTIRVSLTEPPEDEIPVASLIRDLFPRSRLLPYNPYEGLPWNPFRYKKPVTKNVAKTGGDAPPAVWGMHDSGNGDLKPDKYISIEDDQYVINSETEKFVISQITNTEELTSSPGIYRLIDPSLNPESVSVLDSETVNILDGDKATITEIKNWLSCYYSTYPVNPIVLHKSYSETDEERFALLAAGEFGSLLIDGLIDGVWIENPNVDQSYIAKVSFSILQASRARITSTEFIACPSCGRTLFDIQTVLAEVRKTTSHLPGLKIAVMGCIVNGPGEMADADYGYIGTVKGTVSLYRKGEIELKNIPQNQAVTALVELIKRHSDWIDP